MSCWLSVTVFRQAWPVCHACSRRDGNRLRHSPLPGLTIFLQKIRIFAENSSSADDPQKTGVADHDPLTAGFNKVKPARAQLGDEAVAPDFAVDPAQVAADDPAARHGFCAEHFGNPPLSVRLSEDQIHAPILPGHG
jgi:hypothetical protein